MNCVMTQCPARALYRELWNAPDRGLELFQGGGFIVVSLHVFISQHPCRNRLFLASFWC